ncbi:MAG: prolyl oligopeptidase family serine peptidase [Propionibacteriales bacterium]|nr:prolyl oligopeptidase family serine peptidase [Propionibacteriales bacterium]
MTEQPTYPEARRTDLVEILHGEKVADPYRWLEDADTPETKDWLTAQAGLLDAQRARWPSRERFAGRLAELMRTGFHGPPSFRRDRQFFLRRTADQEHGVLHTVEPDGTERVLIDPMRLDPDGTTTLDAYHPSPDGTLLAYQLSEGGTEESTIRVMDVETTEVIDGPIDRTRFSPVAWFPDGSGFYYVRQLDPAGLPEDERQYHRRVRLHRIGQDPADDAMVFGEAQDKEYIWSVSLSRDGRWLIVTGSRGTDPRTDVFIADLAEGDPASPRFETVQQDVDAQTSMGVGIDGRLYVWTDLDSPRGRLLVTDPATPAREHWRPLIDEDPEAVLTDFAILDRLERPLLVVAWTRHAVGELTLHDLGTGERLDTVPLPGLGSVAGVRGRYDGGSEAWFTFTGHVSPPVVYRLDGRDRRVTEWARPPGTLPEVSGIETRLVDYGSYDGPTVRMFVIARADQDGPRPTILYGYGGFGISMAPAYNAGALAWVEAGGVYAVACLRGGGEEGEDWHRAGMLEHKQRVFDDFHAAGEWLCDEGWTTPERLGISGGSNGGLLVGAALTQRPDLYRSVVCSAPLLDMVRYEQRGLGRFWSGEYGSAKDPDQLRALLAYSPYHRVQEGLAYPASLFTVFESDTRVDPSHARKMCAALQSATAADPATHPILIRVETDVGHGARAVSRSVELAADTLAFHAWSTGLGSEAAGRAI